MRKMWILLPLFLLASCGQQETKENLRSTEIVPEDSNGEESLDLSRLRSNITEAIVSGSRLTLRLNRHASACLKIVKNGRTIRLKSSNRANSCAGTTYISGYKTYLSLKLSDLTSTVSRGDSIKVCTSNNRCSNTAKVIGYGLRSRILSANTDSKYIRIHLNRHASACLNIVRGTSPISLRSSSNGNACGGSKMIKGYKTYITLKHTDLTSKVYSGQGIRVCDSSYRCSNKVYVNRSGIRSILQWAYLSDQGRISFSLDKQASACLQIKQNGRYYRLRDANRSGKCTTGSSLISGYSKYFSLKHSDLQSGIRAGFPIQLCTYSTNGRHRCTNPVNLRNRSNQ